MSDSEIRLGTSISRFEVPPRAMDLAQTLAAIHGNVNIVKEASGIHLYMASPVCLRNYGKDELYKMHLAVNVGKYLDGNDMVGLCVKTDTPYKVSDLLRMCPVDPSYFSEGHSRLSIHDRSTEHLFDDGNGSMVPQAPDQTLSIAVKRPYPHQAARFSSFRQVVAPKDRKGL
jgi:hypothetical protein